VKAHNLLVHDLHAADAVYSTTRPVVLTSAQKAYPKAQLVKEDFKRLKLGRPQDGKRAEALLEAASYLEDNKDEQITISNLIDLMNQKTGKY